MDITLIIKIAAVGLIVSVINQVLKQSGRDDYSSIVNLMGIILVLIWVIPYIIDLFDSLKKIFSF
jgi:stage III sporulation protein AC